MARTVVVTITTTREMRRAMGRPTLRDRIIDAIRGVPAPACPYCNVVDPTPETHIAEGRCK